MVQCTVVVEGGGPVPGRVRSAKVSAFLHHTTNHGPELGRGLRTVHSVLSLAWSNNRVVTR